MSIEYLNISKVSLSSTTNKRNGKYIQDSRLLSRYINKSRIMDDIVTEFLGYEIYPKF